MASQCTNCGATVETPPETLSTTCRYCDSPLVQVEADHESVDKLVRFEVNQKRASELISAYLQGKWLAPQRIRKSAKQEEIRDIFVPFYAYEASTRSHWSARIGINWQRTETYTTTDSDGNTVTRTRTVTETEWFSSNGTHASQWHDHLVSASKGLEEEESNELEPFDLGRAKPYVPALVAGVTAELPTIDKETARATAAAELDQLASREITTRFLPGDSSRDVSISTQSSLHATQLVLLPVWMSVYREGGDTLRLLVNGQTGEVVGEVPNSKVKIFFLILFALLVLLLLVSMLAANA